MTENALYAVWLIVTGKPGCARTYRMVRSMDPKTAYHATRAELEPVLGEKDAAFFLNKDLTEARRILSDCAERGIGICAISDPDYPAALREIDDPPPALFYYGRLPDPARPTVGIVGTRKCTRNAACLTASFSCSLTLSGFQIVSGMADGIDTYAHKGTLIRDLPSYAVLGCGPDVIYPKKNETLYRLLREHGGILSEYLPGTPPLAANFPRRNRIISGLSDGVLVMECPPKSGSMITARFAVEQNRTLFAVPAPPGERVNTGTNYLIKHGAVFCTEPNDVTDEFLPRYGDLLTRQEVRFAPADPEEVSAPPAPKKPRRASPAAPPRPTLSPEEAAVFREFSDQPLSADDLCARTGFQFYQLLPILQALELAGCIRSLPGAMFCRN